MDSLMKYISRTARCAAAYRQSVLADEALTGHQHIYILTICRCPGLSQEQLARQIYINKSNVTRQLTALEQNGFIARSADKLDRRTLRIYPTQKAEEVYPRVLAVMQEWNECLMDDFDESQRELLFSMLSRIMEKAMETVSNQERSDKP